MWYFQAGKGAQATLLMLSLGAVQGMLCVWRLCPSSECQQERAALDNAAPRAPALPVQPFHRETEPLAGLVRRGQGGFRLRGQLGSTESLQLPGHASPGLLGL